MIFDNFDAALPAATPMLLPIAGASEALESDSGPTLEDALREIERADRAPDLWVTDAMRGAASPVTVEEAGDNGTAPAEPSDDEAIDAASPQADANAPQDHPLLKEKLSFAELGHMIARQYDSTDYSWEEMSSGDYDWAYGNFKADVYAGVAQVTAGATSQQEADLLAQAYLNSIGLGSHVHVGPAPEADDAIVVTAQTYYHQPSYYMPPLWADQDVLGSFDFANFNSIDASAHLIAVDPDVVLTQAGQEALDRLNIIIERVTNYLNNLPPYAVLMTPKGLFTVAELRAVWALTDFHITKDGTSYSINGIPGHPGAGAADYRNGNPMLETSIDNLILFMRDPERALFYVLHELGHVTSVGYQYLLEIRPPGSPPPSDVVWSASEQFYNDFARAMADAMGHPLGSSFDPNRYGFGDPGQMTFVPDPGSGGGGGEGGGGGHGDVPYN